MSDLRGVLKKINGVKFINASKVLASYYFSRVRGVAALKGLPISMSVEPTTSCNLGCPECPSGLKSFTRPTGNLDLTLFKRLIDEVKGHLVYLTLYFQGEPYINPSFIEMVKTASEAGIYTSTSTNGHFLSRDSAIKTVKSGLGRLIISMDGTDQETYEKYRVRGNLKKVIEGIKTLEAVKKELKSRTPYTEIQFIVFKHNEDQLQDMKDLFRELGSDKLVFKTAQIYNFQENIDFIPQNKKHSRYVLSSNGKYQIKNKLLNHCWRMWHSCVVTWDGKVVPCCFDKDAETVMGDLETTDFSQIWTGSNYEKFRGSLLRSRAEIEICKNCTEGTKVWI